MEKCSIPLTSLLGRTLIDSAYFKDAYCTSLNRPDTRMTAIFFSIFGHHPWWMNKALIARNRLASLAGLEVATAAEVTHIEVKDNYKVGEKIGRWPIFYLTDTELVAGRDDKHLDFRLSLIKVWNGDEASVVVSTVCSVHNVFGKIYLFFIIPFHKSGIQLLIKNAVTAGRL